MCQAEILYFYSSRFPPNPICRYASHGGRRVPPVVCAPCLCTTSPVSITTCTNITLPFPPFSLKLRESAMQPLNTVQTASKEATTGPMPWVAAQAAQLKIQRQEATRQWAEGCEAAAMLSPQDARIALRLLPCEAYRLDVKNHPELPRRALAAQWRRVVEAVDCSVVNPIDGSLAAGWDQVLPALSTMQIFSKRPCRRFGSNTPESVMCDALHRDVLARLKLSGNLFLPSRSPTAVPSCP